MTDVTLNCDEFLSAAQCGYLRFANAGLFGRKEVAPRYVVDWVAMLGDHMLGAVGESAYCKHTGRYWRASVNTFKQLADVGERTEIRTRRPLNAELIVRPSDRADREYVLVVGVPPTVRIVGRIDGADAKRREWYRDPNGMGYAYWVPQWALNPL